MNSQSLYRKWRPQRFSDLKGQDSVRDTLFYAVTQGEASQSYLFCGPRGTGKTTTARLVAKVVNCQSTDSEKPCNTCSACESITAGTNLDIIEVDAASNRGIDEIRQLRESVRFAPTQAKRKVYIIDEVHMLTREAFNALLKTLEEPPVYAMFILATTEAHKIPATIISRCQRYDFKIASMSVLTEHILAVAQAESLPLTPESADFIARLADGSFRDALSILDQVRSSGPENWERSSIEALFGYVPQEQVSAILTAILAGNMAKAHELINVIEASNGDIRALWSQLLSLSEQAMEGRIIGNYTSLPKGLVEGVKTVSPSLLVTWVELLLTAGDSMKQSPIIRLPLDLAIAKFSFSLGKIIEPEAKASESPLPQREKDTPPPITITKMAPTPAKVETVTPVETVTVPVAEAITTPVEPELWQTILQELKTEAPSLVTSLAQAKITDRKDNSVMVAVKYKMHADKINQARNREKIETVIARVAPEPFKIEAHVVRELVVEEEEVNIAEIFDFEE